MVTRLNNRIIAQGRFPAPAVFYFLSHIDECLQKGYTDLVFDFSSTTGAWADSMVPVIATADWLKANGCEVDVILPSDEELHRLFLNTSWAHHLDPVRFASSDVNIDHFNARRFTDAAGQQRAVNEIMRLVVAKLHVPKDVLTGLEWSINEITDNVLTHAEAPSGGVVQVTTHEQEIIFCVADAGRGILRSMREGHPGLRNDVEALGEAVKAGVTRDPRIGQGNGLAGTLRVATMSGGHISIVTHRGRLFIRGGDAYRDLRPHASAFHGTMVAASIRTTGRLNVREALQFPGVHVEPSNILDFHEQEGDAMVLRLANETTGVGSRPAGAFIREKCRHLLTQEPSSVLVIDWAGVPVVSSSFADEAFGKLFAELGPVSFGSRIRHRSMEQVNQGLLDKAIMQRAAQQLSTTARPAGPAQRTTELRPRRRRWRH